MVGDGGDDARHEIILKFEDGLGRELAFVGFCPELGAGDGVGELDRETQFAAGLAQTAIDEVARSEFFADGTDVA